MLATRPPLVRILGRSPALPPGRYHPGPVQPFRRARSQRGATGPWVEGAPGLPGGALMVGASADPIRCMRPPGYCRDDLLALVGPLPGATGCSWGRAGARWYCVVLALFRRAPARCYPEDVAGYLSCGWR